MKIAIKNYPLFIKVFVLKIINIVRINNVYVMYMSFKQMEKKNCQIIYYNQYINDILKNTHTI